MNITHTVANDSIAQRPKQRYYLDAYQCPPSSDAAVLDGDQDCRNSLYSCLGLRDLNRRFTIEHRMRSPQPLFRSLLGFERVCSHALLTPTEN